MKEKYEMTYNKKHFTVMANDIIKGKQEMTLQEARIIRLLVTQVVKEDKDFKTYICRIQDLADFLGVSSENLYRDIKTICRNLLKSAIEIGTNNPKEPWKMFSWVQKAEYDGNGNITLMLSEQIKPYVLELEKWFTQYPIGNILSMRSFYAIRLYELLKCEDGVSRNEKDFLEFTIGFLRAYFCCENKFERISAFKEYVIETATKEVNEKTDIYVDVEYIKTGREVTSVKFWMHVNIFSKDKAVLK